MAKTDKLHDKMFSRRNLNNVSENTMAATSTPVLAIVARMAVNELERRAAKIPAHATSAPRVAHNTRTLITLLELSIKGRTA